MQFIARKTYHNLLRLVKGFLGYAIEIFKHDATTHFVPALHCNQSTLEGTFSKIRHMGKDRTDVYGTGILVTNIHAFTKKK